MTLKLYVDRMSQPSRALILFCKANGIEFEEVKIVIAQGQHLTPEYEATNPMKQVPAIDDGGFKLFESHAILIYLASAFPGVADHWYPADLHERARVHSVLDWHHSNLRRGSAQFVANDTLFPLLGRPLNPQAAADAEVILSSSLAKIESFWLQENGPFLLGNSQPTIADLSLFSEIMELEVVEDKVREQILGPHKKVQRWIDDTKIALQPYFDEVHVTLFKAKEKIQKIRSDAARSEPKPALL